MNVKNALLVVAALLAVGAVMFLRPQGDTSPTDAHRLVAEGARLVDVRSPGEFAAGHIEGAVNIPVQVLGARLAELGPPATTKLVVYCQSGGRSATATRLLRDAGFTAVHDLGPMSAWSKSGG